MYSPYIRAYYRYVDDTFNLFRGSNTKAEHFVKYFNKINKNI